MRLSPSCIAWAAVCNLLIYLEPTIRLLVCIDSSRAVCITSMATSFEASLSWCFTTSKFNLCHWDVNVLNCACRLNSYVAVTDMFTISSACWATLRSTNWPKENCFSCRGKSEMLKIALISVQCQSLRSLLPSASTVGMVSLKSNTIYLRYCTAVLASGKFLSHNRTVLACFYDFSRISSTSICSNGETCQISMFMFHSWIADHSLTW